MLEGLTERAGAMAKRRAEVRILVLTDRLKAALPEDIEVGPEEEGVVLKGRGLQRRFTLDGALRWILAGVR
jgi:hypothetical protein